MQGNKALAQFDVMTGLSNDQDGYNFWDSYKTDPIYQKDKNFYNGTSLGNTCWYFYFIFFQL